MSLKASILRGSLWSVAGGAGQQAANFFIFLYLARALDPAAIGLVALAAILVEIVTALAKMGMVEAMQPQAPDRHLETAILAILGISGVVGALVILMVAGGAWIASYDSIFITIIAFLAPITLFQAVNALPEALFRRRLDYRSLALRKWLATLIAGGVAILMVSKGFGVFALVGQRLASEVVSTVLLWGQIGWRPVRSVEFSRARPTLAIGWKVVVASVSGLLNTRIADAITGAFLGPALLGFLRLGWRFRDTLVQLSVQPMSSVALTSLSRLNSDPAARTRAYLRLTQFMAAASLPIFFGLGAVAEPLLRVLLGEKWMGATIVFQALGALMTAGCVNYFFGPVMVAVGRADVVMRQSVAQVLLTLPLMWIGSYAGLVGVLVAHVLRACIAAVYNLTAVRRHAGISIRSTLAAIVPAFIASLLMRLAVDAALQWAPLSSDVQKLVLGVAVGAISYATLLLLGDLLGIWHGYVRHAVASFGGAWKRPKP